MEVIIEAIVHGILSVFSLCVEIAFHVGAFFYDKFNKGNNDKSLLKKSTKVLITILGVFILSIMLFSMTLALIIFL